MTDQNTDEAFTQLLEYLRRARGFDFAAYKRSTLQRRMQKRLQTVGVDNYAEYSDYLEVHPDEFAALFNTILINVTDFYRDPAAWDVIRDNVIPRILSAKAPDEPVRVWSAGCAAGQEAYSIAMLLVEALGEGAYRQRVKIYATDVDQEALNEARPSTYTEQQVAAVPAALRDKYFDRVNDHYSFRKDLRRSVIFGRHDLLNDAPISRVDLLICRNTLMYFNAEAQTRVLARFEFALNGTGYLFLGKAEVMLSRSTAFVPLDIKRRIFSKRRTALAHERSVQLAAGNNGLELASPESDLLQLALEMDPLAQVVLDLDGNVLLVNAQARLLFNLRPAEQDKLMEPTWLHPVDLRLTSEQALREERLVQLKEVEWASAGEKRYLDVSAFPLLDGQGRPLGVKLTFSDVTRQRRLQAELQTAHQELETANEELQSSNEELETTNEELQSTVEELETTNEELQSTNEELETMNEELQSTNEELDAANTELRQRRADADRMNAFLESVMAGMRDGVVVLDNNLMVRAWNQQAEELWGLRADEVRGQHFLGLDIGLPVDQVRPIIRASLAGEPRSTHALELMATNRRGRSMQVRVAANRLVDATDVLQGVILVMEELLPDGGGKEHDRRLAGP